MHGFHVAGGTLHDGTVNPPDDIGLAVVDVVGADTGDSPAGFFTGSHGATAPVTTSVHQPVRRRGGCVVGVNAGTVTGFGWIFGPVFGAVTFGPYFATPATAAAATPTFARSLESTAEPML